jgi:hypothetical protein
MERIFLNQAALSLGYIALKRIRALEEPTSPRLPSNHLLRHLGHTKVLAACIEQVGPEEIIEYELNQDNSMDAVHSDVPVLTQYDAGGELDQRVTRLNTADDVFEPRYPEATRRNTSLKQLEVITEDNEEHEYDEPQSHNFEPNSLFIVSLARTDVEEDGDYSMDELYDEYNSLDDEWETASEASDASGDEQDHDESVRLDHLSIPRSLKSIDTDSEEEEDTPTPPSAVVSRSPPLDIMARHPITHELNRREQFRKQADTAASDLSRAFIEQFEDVLSHEMHRLSVHNVPGKVRL